jgi:ABC-type transport system involved in cytochrome bd biosynthesis fused ATPase/permease subunit
VVFVTHDAFIARHTQRIIRLVDGKIISDEQVAHPLAAGTPRLEEAVVI